MLMLMYHVVYILLFILPLPTYSQDPSTTTQSQSGPVFPPPFNAYAPTGSLTSPGTTPTRPSQQQSTSSSQSKPQYTTDRLTADGIAESSRRVDIANAQLAIAAGYDTQLYGYLNVMAFSILAVESFGTLVGLLSDLAPLFATLQDDATKHNHELPFNLTHSLNTCIQLAQTLDKMQKDCVDNTMASTVVVAVANTFLTIWTGVLTGVADIVFAVAYWYAGLAGVVAQQIGYNTLQIALMREAFGNQQAFKQQYGDGSGSTTAGAGTGTNTVQSVMSQYINNTNNTAYDLFFPTHLFSIWYNNSVENKLLGINIGQYIPTAFSVLLHPYLNTNNVTRQFALSSNAIYTHISIQPINNQNTNIQSNTADTIQNNITYHYTTDLYNNIISITIPLKYGTNDNIQYVAFNYDNKTDTLTEQRKNGLIYNRLHVSGNDENL